MKKFLLVLLLFSAHDTSTMQTLAEKATHSGASRLMEIPFSQAEQNLGTLPLEVREQIKQALLRTYRFAIWKTCLNPLILGGINPGFRGSPTINAIALSKDHRYAFAGGEKGALCFWDLHQDPVVSAELKGHAHNISQIALSHNTNSAVSFERETVRIWDLSRLGQTSLISKVFNHAQRVPEAFALSDTNGMAVSGWQFNNLNISEWELEKGPQSAVQQVTSAVLRSRHDMVINSIKLSPTGRYALTTSANNRIIAWDLDKRALQTCTVIEGPAANVLCTAISRNGRFGATGSSDSTFRLYDFQQKKLVHEFHDDSKSMIRCVAISNDGTFALSAAWDSLVAIDVSKQPIVSEKLDAHICLVSFIALSEDGKGLLIASNNTVTFCDLDPLQKLTPLQALATIRFLLGTLSIENGAHVLSTLPEWLSSKLGLSGKFSEHTK